jgi:hypothetical protein
MVNGRWQRPALASSSSPGVEYEAQFSVDGNTDIYRVDANAIEKVKGDRRK